MKSTSITPSSVGCNAARVAARVAAGESDIPTARVNDPIGQAPPRRGQEGLTLVELLVVILLIGLIGGGMGVAVMKRFRNAKVGIAQNKVKEIADAINFFVLENNNLPDSLAELKSTEGSGPYYADSLIDPWGSEYILQELSEGEYDVRSLGEDKEPGGEGRAKDISFKELTMGAEEGL